MVRQYNNKSGMTLVEVLLVLALMGVLITGILSVFTFGNRTFTMGRNQYDLQTDVRFAIDTIAQNIRFASKVKIVDLEDAKNLTKENAYSFYIEEEKLFHNSLDNEPVLVRKGPFSSESLFKSSQANSVEIKMHRKQDRFLGRSYFGETKVQLLNSPVNVDDNSVSGKIGLVYFTQASPSIVGEVPKPEPPLEISLPNDGVWKTYDELFYLGMGNSSNIRENTAYEHYILMGKSPTSAPGNANTMIGAKAFKFQGVLEIPNHTLEVRINKYVIFNKAILFGDNDNAQLTIASNHDRSIAAYMKKNDFDYLTISGNYTKQLFKENAVEWYKITINDSIQIKK